ncbi:hypothetical protein KIN20_016385 [Parelaphostrongylus tenuis]|uniref:Uncharacterized protein n=1 Tax=Parelaphostrongylus tenuis TaxID=148309 RepID=A0AAD5QT61_PARTN|nr:hypothetical protein KIN20_016385 [Parelaphostrongylus tenuis]
MSVASASAYSSTYSDEIVIVETTNNTRIQEEDLQTAVENMDEDIDDPWSERNSLEYNIQIHSSPKSAKMSTSVYTTHPCGKDTDREHDVFGAASPVSTAVTGNISWYSLPPSESSVEVSEVIKSNQVKDDDNFEKVKMLRCQDYLENVSFNETMTTYGTFQLTEDALEGETRYNIHARIRPFTAFALFV